MLLTPINLRQYYNQNKFSTSSTPPVFSANVKPAGLEFAPCDFFIKIKGYGKSYIWAEKILKTADEAVQNIQKGKSFDDVLKSIANGVRRANSTSHDADKKVHSGILRTRRAGWKDEHSPEWSDICTRYGFSGLSRYDSYESRLDYVAHHPLKNPYNDLSICRIRLMQDKFMDHPSSAHINKSLDYIDVKYKYLTEKYLKKTLQTEDMEDINSNIAEIRWIMAHATPFERGSDAIANVFVKALYKSLGIRTSSPAKGVSFDLEAYCTNLAQYKQNFPKYFVKPPSLI